MASRSNPSPTQARATAKARAERAHERYVQRVYGLAPGEYEARLAAQGGRCAICGRLARRRRLAVDHDHNTGRVRALLCYTCNKALGWWEFDPIAAHNAAVYLASIAADYDRRYDPLPAPRLEAHDEERPRLHLSFALPPRTRRLPG